MNNSDLTGMDQAYPRVLIVNGAAFGDHSATAVTLTNLFAGWPSGHLALVHFDTLASNPSGDICPQIWQLSSADVPFVRAIVQWRNKHRARLANQMRPDGHAHTTKLASPRTSARKMVSSWADLFPLRPTCEFWQFIDTYKPDLVYSMLASARIMDLVLRITNRTGARVVPHIMDDWIQTCYPGLGQAIPRLVMHRRFQSILNQAPLGLTIGEDMSVEYGRRYGGRWEAFMNCVEVPKECPRVRNTQLDGPVKLLFVGGLHLNRWQMVAAIDNAIQLLRGMGVKALLEVCAPEGDIKRYGPELSNCRNTVLHPLPEGNRLFEYARSANILVHLDSFDQATREYLRFSVSTKIPLYMSSSRPILAYGPEEVGTCRYVANCGCGIVVGEQREELLLEALQRLITNAELRNRLGQRAWEVAKERHDRGINRNRFRAAMERAVIATSC